MSQYHNKCLNFIRFKVASVTEYHVFKPYFIIDEADPDEEIESNVLNGDDFQLVLPSGAVIGHRSLVRYYK